MLEVHLASQRASRCAMRPNDVALESFGISQKPLKDLTIYRPLAISSPNSVITEVFVLTAVVPGELSKGSAPFCPFFFPKTWSNQRRIQGLGRDALPTPTPFWPVVSFNFLFPLLIILKFTGKMYRQSSYPPPPSPQAQRRLLSP